MDDDSESLKRQRTKYVSKACVECKRRKIKCNGEDPCMRCLTVNTQCEYVKNKARGGARRAGQSIDQAREPSLEDVLGRLQAVEQGLQLFYQHYPIPGMDAADLTKSLTAESPTNSQHLFSPSTSAANGQTQSFGPPGAAPSLNSNSTTTFESPGVAATLAESVFYGQSSSVGTLSNLRNQLTSFAPSDVRTQAEIFAQQNQPEGPKSTRLLVEQYVVPNRIETFTILNSMFEDLMSMYPLLHPPTFFNRYGPLWDHHGDFQPHIASSDLFTSSELGLLYACLASSATHSVAKPTFSPTAKYKSVHLWYSAAKLLVLDQKIDHVVDLESVQTMILLSFYLMHSENEDASYKVTGMAIRAAYEIGLHLSAREANLPRATVELRRRAWWCLYLLDRRTSISLGRPCGIQDSDSDVEYPTALNDQHPFPEQFEVPIQVEQSKIPYLIQFVGFSSVCGEIYNKVYGVKCRWPPDERTVLDLDSRLEQWRFNLPPFLRFDQSNLGTLPIWLCKQQLFLYLRGAHVRLLLMRPFVSDHDDQDNATHHKMAESALRLSSEIIHTISLVKKTSNIVERIWYPSKQIVLSCIGIIFWVVLNYPTKFSASSSKIDLRIALRLLKSFSESSIHPQSTRNLRDVEFLRYLCNQALKSRNHAQLESAVQSPAPEPIFVPTDGAWERNSDTDLSFLGIPEVTDHDLLMNLLDSGDAAYLPSTEQFLMMGEDTSRQSMMSL